MGKLANISGKEAAKASFFETVRPRRWTIVSRSSALLLAATVAAGVVMRAEKLKPMGSREEPVWSSRAERAGSFRRSEIAATARPESSTLKGGSELLHSKTTGRGYGNPYPYVTKGGSGLLHSKTTGPGYGKPYPYITKGGSEFLYSKATAAGKKIDFHRDIAPIFAASCKACHGAEKAEGQLRLDSEAAILRGGVSGKALVPGKSDESLLVKRLLGTTDAPRMPLGADALPAEKIDLIRAWIDHASFAAVDVRAHGRVPLPSLGREASHVEAATGSSEHLGRHRPPLQSKASHPQIATKSTLFVAKIRPILAARCYQCHGPDVQQNGLRLDSLAAALKGSALGRVIVPGQSEKSPLVRRVLGLDRPQMPYGGPALTAEQVRVIRHWIDQGAPGPDSTELIVAAKRVKHWAYIKPAPPSLPAVKNTAWVRNPIDNFILARLEKERLSPSPEADKETLIRRASLDLIGLPPTIEEVDTFLADQSPNAYEKVVDRLLASPHYGERWARPWLDLARYADTNGYEKDNRRTAWKYRDWVINAPNQDMSFREFSIDQIAGDMLPNATTEQKIASGFHRNTLLNQEGGIDPEEARWETLVDRVNTTASVWLGTTLACAQCHNHKYDPFTQKDYYRFLAFFDNGEYQVLKLGQGAEWVLEPQLELPTPEQETQSNELKAEIARLRTVLSTPTPDLEAAQAQWEREMKGVAANRTVLRPSHFSSVGGATLKLLEDQSLLASGKNPEADTYVLEAKTDRTGITGVRIEVLGDASLPHGGPGRDPDGNFFLSALEVEATPADQSGPVQKVVFKDAVADESEGGYSVKNLVNEGPKPKGWAIDSSASSAPLIRQAALIPEKPFGFERGTVLTIRLKHEMLHASRNIGRFRLSVTSIADPGSIASLPARLRPILDIPVAKRTQEQNTQLAAAYRSLSPLLKPTRDRIAELQKSLDKLGIVTSLIMQERRSFDRPSTYLRVRGSYLSKGEKVFAGVPAVLQPMPEDEMPNRLGLAFWLVDEDNPLTARVTVNRYWEQFFGRGIVETSEDFGTQGERPIHPELLDWLATEFMRQGWSMKAIKRLIVTSATYRQSSRVTPERLERDPYNKLLARGPRFRVEAEMVRDIALAASGLLSPKIGGPSVFPYQPEGVWDRPYNNDKWVMSEGEDRYRRSIYTFIRRTSPYPSLINFDAPSREFCTVRRIRTNTPLQALTTLNDPAFFEAVQALARSMMADAGPDASARAIYGFRRCVSRRPTPEEVDRILAFYHQQLDRFQKDANAAAEVVGAGLPGSAGVLPASAAKMAALPVKGYTGPPSGVPELAAWTMVSNVLLNLDETITKE